jgi:thiol-disulfide isomerase/thioredoxin
MSRRRMGLALVAPALLPAQAAADGASPVRADGSEKLREGRRPAPAVTFTDAEGREHGFQDFPGEGLVVNLWATWCPPCVAEMPALDRLQALLRGERVRVLPLSSDRGGRAVVEGFYQRLGLRELGLWLDPRGAAARGLGVRGLPTTVILDRAGFERARLEGEAEWDSPALVAAVRRLVEPLAGEATGRT